MTGSQLAKFWYIEARHQRTRGRMDTATAEDHLENRALR